MTSVPVAASIAPIDQARPGRAETGNMKLITILMLALALSSVSCKSGGGGGNGVSCTCGTPEADFDGCSHPLCVKGERNPDNPECVCGPMKIGGK